MESLTITDPPPPQSGPQGPNMTLGRAPPVHPQQQQLPPQMFTTAAQLLDLTDTNLVLQSTIERIFVHPTQPETSSIPDTDTDTATPTTPSSRGLYADIPHGVFLVRGENVLLLGEIDLDKDDDPPPGYDKAEADVVKKMAKERKAAAKEKDKKRIGKLSTMGFEGENMGEILL
ncbi:hypothetical protein MKZ38_010271 [Zalerion maritima]|uniref:U6 snRNA-associated Sm-like protein LSm1 n=1 Tax=Zalerion maritima TaxID=339359 RepID=A0AAD5RGM7_9PEZI|nr:hypothetical protein MKZ38_010271 [Zalerion maritima]